MNRPTSRRTVLTAAIAAAAAAGTVSSAGSATAATPSAAPPHTPSAEAPAVDNHFWHTYTDWRSGSGAGTRVAEGR
ncbi:peptidase C39 family protein, partial [Streptomyces sp. NPDC059221]